MTKKNRGYGFRRNSMLIGAAILVAALGSPIIGSAANLSSTSFAVKAVNSQDTSRFAIKPFFKATPTASATPTAPATTTPAAPAVTTLKSYTFETGTDFNGWSGSHRDTTSFSHGGSHSLYDSFIGKGTYYVNPPIGAVTYVVGQTYTVSAWVLNESGYGTTTQLVAQNDAASSSAAITATRDWIQVSATFVAKSDTPSINFVLTVPGSSAFIHIDDVTISQIS